LLEGFPEHREPAVHGFNARLYKTTGAFCSVDSPDDQSRVFEHLEVLGDCWLRYVEGLR
jgi:hypothetical protein